MKQAQLVCPAKQHSFDDSENASDAACRPGLAIQGSPLHHPLSPTGTGFLPAILYVALSQMATAHAVRGGAVTGVPAVTTVSCVSNKTNLCAVTDPPIRMCHVRSGRVCMAICLVHLSGHAIA